MGYTDVTNTGNGVSKTRIIPEIYSELVREKIAGAVKVAQFADNLGALVNKEVGETVQFNCWKYIGDASDINPGTPMTAVQLAQKQDTATIKMIAAPGVKVYDYDDMTQMGRAIDEGASQQGVSVARKLDTDLINDALGSPFKIQTATKNKITEDELMDALGLYGDDRDLDKIAGIVCHSKFAKSFYKMDGFVKKDIVYVNEGNGPAYNGVIGSWMGIPVVLSDRLYDTANTEGFLLLIKKKSLGYMPKEEPFVEQERNAASRSTTVYTSQVYATKLTDEAGIVVCKTVVA